VDDWQANFATVFDTLECPANDIVSFVWQIGVPGNHRPSLILAAPRSKVGRVVHHAENATEVGNHGQRSEEHNISSRNMPGTTNV